tara:strand:+ start:3071 stop:3535 length:465 start_codon:yes stop_codon:yes gene_type:complete
LKLYNKHRNVELVINEQLLDKISEAGIKHYPNEFGGFLIGNYSDDYKTLNVNDFVLPENSKGNRFMFERSSKGMTAFFQKLFRKKKQFYIGEWHTHPNGSTGFSNIDLNAMIEIESSPSVVIENPVLLILSISDTKLNQATFYVYDNKNLLPYE